MQKERVENKDANTAGSIVWQNRHVTALARREGDAMIRKLDRLWFRLLGVVHRWTIRRGQAHCRREKMRRFWRHLAWQNSNLN